MSKRTLLLNNDHKPYGVISYKDAIIGCFNAKYYCVETYDRIIRSAGGLEIKCPAVVVSKAFCRRKKIPCKPYNLFARDSFRCGYCLHTFKPKDLTRDHIVPRDKGGKTSWTNLVSSCSKCNSKKANKIWEPKIRVYEPSNILDILNENIPAQWKPYVKV